jgi:hypothetical protein
MNSPLVRVIAATIGGYMLILLGLFVHDWYKWEYPHPPDQPPSQAQIQHPFYHGRAIESLRKFSQLPAPERRAIVEELESAMLSMEEWLALLDRSGCQVLCLGECHEESTRQFLSEAFFANFHVDFLLLEATPDKLARLMRKMRAGRRYFPLLDADIMNVLRSVRNRSPDVMIHGIEETEQQQVQAGEQVGSRDFSMTRNFWSHFRPGMRHIILVGALHCRNDPNWLFGLLRGQASEPLKQRMVNTWVLGEHQKGPLEAFLFFLEEVGVEPRTDAFVIPDTRALPPRLRNWFPTLNHQLLEQYRSLIVFRR